MEKNPLTSAAVLLTDRLADADLLSTDEGLAYLRALASLLDLAGDAETAEWLRSFPGF